MRLISLAGVLAAAVPSPLAAQASVSAGDLIGTWQIITATNVKTGKVDSVAKHRLQWNIFTATHRVSIASNTGRKIPKASAVAAMNPEQRMKAHYSQVWGPDGEQVFSANAGSYRLRGNIIEYTFEIALSTDSGTTAKYTIISLNRSNLVYRTEPNAQGEVSEVTLQRLH